MKKMFPFIFTALLLTFSGMETATAKDAKPANYVVFNVKGDCGQEDCIALLRDALADQQTAIVSMDLTSLAAHQTVEYKTVSIAFKDLKTAPYAGVMERIAAQGYDVVSYVIHDLSSGHDIIIPH